MLGLLENNPISRFFEKLFAPDRDTIELDPHQVVGLTDAGHMISLIGDHICLDKKDTGYRLGDLPSPQPSDQGLLQAIQNRIGVL